MANLKACRFCLITDVKMQDIQDTLEDNITAVFGRNVFYPLKLPPYACYQCVAMMEKFNNFRNKYLISQSVLYEMLEDYGEIRKSKIKILDRKAFGLKSNLSKINLEVIEWLPEDGLMKRVDSCDDRLLDIVVGDESSDDDYLLSNMVSQLISNDTGQENETNNRESELFGVTPQKNTRKVELDDDLLNDFVITNLTKEQQIAEVKKRKESSNYKDSVYKCTLCYKGFLQLQTLDNHMLRHLASAGDIVCEVCKCRFNTRRAHSIHAVKHTKKYACNACNFVTLHSQQAKQHKQWHDNSSYKCDYCNEVSSKLSSHQSHVQRQHSKALACEVCRYSFDSPRALNMHKARMHQLISRDKPVDLKDIDKKQECNVYCKVCDLQFSTKETWKRHMVTSSKHRDNLGSSYRQCDVVGGVVAVGRAPARRAVSRRVRERTRSAPAALPVRYPTKCVHCKEMIPNWNQYWRHYQRHHKDKKYHLAENKYICEECGKGFRSNAILLYHARTHAVERAYSCAFPSAHNRLPLAHPYAERRAHACTICFNTFNSKTGLQQHFSCHTSICPFRCRYCGKEFFRGACLSQHVKHVHLRPLLCTEKLDRPQKSSIMVSRKFMHENVL